MSRFTGTVDLLGPVDAEAIRDWITAIDFEDWPQQTRLDDGGIRPAMVTDLMWHGFATVVGPVVDQVMAEFPGARTQNLMMTVVMLRFRKRLD